MDRIVRHSKKVLIGVVGGLVFLLGLVLIPYPGPGWLIVFAGLAILATEFEFAARALTFLREKYDGWVAWLKRQPVWVKVLVLSATGAVVLLTVWLLNGFGLIVTFLGLDAEWLISPLFR